MTISVLQFGNHADTEWMRERQLESLYRQRLDARRHSDRAIQDLYDELVAGRDAHERAWMAIVAYPRVTLLDGQLDKDQVRAGGGQGLPRADPRLGQP